MVGTLLGILFTVIWIAGKVRWENDTLETIRRKVFATGVAQDSDGRYHEVFANSMGIGRTTAGLGRGKQRTTTGPKSEDADYEGS